MYVLAREPPPSGQGWDAQADEEQEELDARADAAMADTAASGVGPSV